MPAFTMVAEWRYALTGAGAAMALGNQKWKGNWADLVNAPSKIKIRIVVNPGWAAKTATSICSNSEILNVPAKFPSKMTPAKKHSPPAPVTSKACKAAARDFASLW